MLSLLSGSRCWEKAEQAETKGHACTEYQGRERRYRERCDAGAGTQAGETPACPEERRTADQARIDWLCRGQVEGVGDDRLRPASDHRPSDRHRDQGAAHDESERRVPCAADVEKRADTGGIDHARERQSGPEQDAARQRYEYLPVHAPSPAMRRTVTVAIPVAMKVPVAANDRGDRRAMPTTP